MQGITWLNDPHSFLHDLWNGGIHGLQSVQINRLHLHLMEILVGMFHFTQAELDVEELA